MEVEGCWGDYEFDKGWVERWRKEGWCEVGCDNMGGEEWFEEIIWRGGMMDFEVGIERRLAGVGNGRGE